MRTQRGREVVFMLRGLTPLPTTLTVDWASLWIQGRQLRSASAGTTNLGFSDPWEGEFWGIMRLMRWGLRVPSTLKFPLWPWDSESLPAVRVPGQTAFSGLWQVVAEP